MPTIRVHTTQNVSLEYEIASVGDRILGTLIDNAILFFWILGSTLAVAAMKLGDTLTGIVLIGLCAVPYVFYNLVCEVFFNGQSIGKRTRNMRVIRLDGTTPRLGDYLLRWLLRIVDFVLPPVPFVGGIIAVITVAANGKGQRLGDLAAGTTVVKLRPVAPQALPSMADLAALETYQVVFPQAAQLADHDVALVRQLLQRASANKDYTLLNEIANKIKSLTGIQTDLQDFPFVQTVLRDHAHLAGK